MRHRLAVALVAALLVAMAPMRDAGAQGYDQWHLSGHGSAHVVYSGIQLVVYRQSCEGCGTYVVDDWPPWWCQLYAVQPGNGVGLPLRIYLAAPVGWGLGCYPGQNGSPWYGWTTGTGHYEGQRRTSWPAAAQSTYIGGRNPASPDAYGTLIEVW